MFQNAEIWGKKISQTPYVGFYPISSQDPKDFWAETSVEGWTFQSKIFSCDFLYDVAKKSWKRRDTLLRKVVATITWWNLNMTRHFEPKKNRSLEKESLAEIVASCSKLLFCKVTRETTQKGPTSNVKFYPLRLSQAWYRIKFNVGGLAYFFPQISAFWNTLALALSNPMICNHHQRSFSR